MCDPSSGRCRRRCRHGISTESPWWLPGPTTTASRTRGRWPIWVAWWERPVAVRTRAYEADAAAVAALDTRLVGIGTWLALAADIFFFAAWWFAFFYLRALNNNQAWKAQGVAPPSRGSGAVMVVLALATAVAYFVGSRPAAGAFLFRLLTPVAVVFG